MAKFPENVKEWFEDLANWIQENLGDPAIAAALRDDLGLEPGKEVPKAQRDQIQQFAQGFDPDKKAFDETVAELSEIIQTIIQLAEQISSDQISGWEVAYLWGKISAVESVRLRNPLGYALGKLALLITSDPEQLTELDPAILTKVAKGDVAALGSGEDLLQRLNSLSLLTFFLEGSLENLLGNDFLDAYYGWDPPPDTSTPEADLVSTRANTFIIKAPDDIGGQLAITIIGVPAEHSGPALFLSVGGGISTTQTVGAVDYKLDAGVASGLNFFIPFSKEAHDFEVSGASNTYVKFSVIRNAESPNEPALRIGDADKTRLDIAGLGLGLDLLSESAGFRNYLKEGALIITLGEGDGFLQSLSTSEIELGFDVGLTVDTLGGVRLDGGTLLRSIVPVNKTLGGFLDVHHVDLMLGPANEGSRYDAALELSTAFGVTLGPFQASVDRVGLKFEFAFKEGNLGFMDAAVGFKEPSGVGLFLNGGIVKGGGYLFFDPQRGEYAGALELKFASWGLKAIGILSTKMPDGSSGFALLLLIYADLPRFHIAFGIFFEGVGGLIGLQHGVDISAIQAGIPSGVFDDILFPANPVTDAPRIINRLRAIFPIRAHAFLIGPMFRLSWGTPIVGEIKLGVVLALDNVLGGDQPVSLNSILLLGQIRIGLPESRRGDIARIICDFFGYLDFGNKRFGFYARLRDSRLAGGLELTGSLVLQIDFGDHPSFVVAVGGFHPRFQDLPSGLPAKLDRLGLRFDIGIVKVTILCYVAVTSATVQFGAELSVKVKLGPVSIDGWIGFDALIYYEPFFRFELDFRAGVTVKFKSFTLMSIDVTGFLSGPGLWHITGKFKFSILFWDIEKSFDEQWGDRPQLDVAATSVSELLQAAYNDPNNWSAALPAGTDTLVTLSALKGETAILAHPLGQLRVIQKVAPLGLTLDKYGETPIVGPSRFDLQQVTVGGTAIANPEMTHEHLARGNYLNLSEEDRLSKPSFETFNVGVAVGTTDYVVPESAVTDGNLNYESKILEPDLRLEFLGKLITVSIQTVGVTLSRLEIQSRVGAAAAAQLRQHERFRTKAVSQIVLQEPALSIVETERLTTQVILAGLEKNNMTLAQQRLSVRGRGYTQIVEQFELV